MVVRGWEAKVFGCAAEVSILRGVAFLSFLRRTRTRKVKRGERRAFEEIVAKRKRSPWRLDRAHASDSTRHFNTVSMIRSGPGMIETHWGSRGDSASGVGVAVRRRGVDRSVKGERGYRSHQEGRGKWPRTF